MRYQSVIFIKVDKFIHVQWIATAINKELSNISLHVIGVYYLLVRLQKYNNMKMNVPYVSIEQELHGLEHGAAFRFVQNIGVRKEV